MAARARLSPSRKCRNGFLVDVLIVCEDIGKVSQKGLIRSKAAASKPKAVQSPYHSPALSVIG